MGEQVPVGHQSGTETRRFKFEHGIEGGPKVVFNGVETVKRFKKVVRGSSMPFRIFKPIESGDKTSELGHFSH